MSHDADLELQKAIYARLGANAPLAALIATRIYDNAPGDTAFPYVTLGENETSDESGDETDLIEHRLTIYVWSRSGGRSEAKSIMAAITDTLHDADLELAGHSLINLRVVSAETRRASDNATWLGALRFRAVTQKT